VSHQILLATPDVARNRVDLKLETLVSRAFDAFDWNGHRWQMRFQSWVRKPNEGPPILEVFDEYPEEHPDYKVPSALPCASLEEQLAAFLSGQWYKEAMEQDKRGWHLKRLGTGVEGWFDPSVLPETPKDKKPFASFDLVLEGTVYRCQFHIWELHSPRPKPVEWDHRRGASAGLPSLGKRR
jgi:hypothetical protein